MVFGESGIGKIRGRKEFELHTRFSGGISPRVFSLTEGHSEGRLRAGGSVQNMSTVEVKAEPAKIVRGTV